jgi:hypothetical protein
LTSKNKYRPSGATMKSNAPYTRSKYRMKS